MTASRLFENAISDFLETGGRNPTPSAGGGGGGDSRGQGRGNGREKGGRRRLQERRGKGTNEDGGGGAGVGDELDDGLAQVNDLDVTWGFDMDAFMQERTYQVLVAGEAGHENPRRWVRQKGRRGRLLGPGR